MRAEGRRMERLEKMDFVASLTLCLPTVAFTRAARRRLATLVPPEIAAVIWRNALSIRREIKRDRPNHSMGVNLLLRYMEWDCALYRAMREQGLPPERAGDLIAEINWDLFKGPIATAFGATRLIASRPQTRIRFMLDAMFALVFTAPFQRSKHPSGEGLVFDVLVCPLAAYFKQQGLPELTRHAACSLDYRMAAQWGAGFRRRQTLAEGAPSCDFRFTLDEDRDDARLPPPEPRAHSRQSSDLAASE